MDNRFGYYGMDFPLRTPTPVPANNASLPYLYYTGLPKPAAGGAGGVQMGSHRTLRSPAALAPVCPPGPSSGSRSFAAALRNLAKQAGPGSEREREGCELDGRLSPTKRPPPPPLIRGPSPQVAAPQPEKVNNCEQRSGFQPYRPEEPRIPPVGVPPPHFSLEYPPYHPHPALYPPHHLQHYRIEEQMYLERCGVGMSPLFPTYPSPSALYGLMPSPLGMISPVMHERLKLEEEHRQREQERERERDRDRREKNKKANPRGSPSHSLQETSARKASVATLQVPVSQSRTSVPHIVRPFEDTFPPQQSPLVEQQLPRYQATNHVPLPPPPPPSISVNHSRLVPEPIVPTLALPLPPSSSPQSITMLSCHKYSHKVKSRLDSGVMEVLEDVSPQLVLTKGPPDKLDASPHKLHFLATFGLTTLTTRNELELTKLERCRSLPSVFVEEGVVEPEVEPRLSLPQPRCSPRSLPRGADKLTFLSSLHLSPVERRERREREAIWQEVLAERRRRQCVTPLVQYCYQQRVNSPDNSPVRWPGIEGILQAYNTYHTECKLEEGVLHEERSRLEAELNVRREEVSFLEVKLIKLQKEREELNRVAQETQQSVDALMAVVRAVMALGHSND